MDRREPEWKLAFPSRNFEIGSSSFEMDIQMEAASSCVGGWQSMEFHFEKAVNDLICNVHPGRAIHVCKHASAILASPSILR